ncbi:MAG TPA: hypothetical protein VG013_32820, partial [Gemmataceae bacterium]|nr:hypothetical protein [Gemmataceae bacterium]
MSRVVLALTALTLLTLDTGAGRGGDSAPYGYEGGAANDAYGVGPAGCYGTGPTPVVHALAKAQGDRILIRQYPMVSVNEMRTTIRVVKDGKAQPIPSPNYLVVKTFPREVLSRENGGKVQALDAHGRKVGPEALRQRLR